MNVQFGNLLHSLSCRQAELQATQSKEHIQQLQGELDGLRDQYRDAFSSLEEVSALLSNTPFLHAALSSEGRERSESYARTLG